MPLGLEPNEFHALAPEDRLFHALGQETENAMTAETTPPVAPPAPKTETPAPAAKAAAPDDADPNFAFEETEPDGKSAELQALERKLANVEQRLAQPPAAEPKTEAKPGYWERIAADQTRTPEEREAAQEILAERTERAKLQQEVQTLRSEREQAAMDQHQTNINRDLARFQERFPGCNQETVDKIFVGWERAAEKNPALAHLRFEEVARRTLGSDALDAMRRPASPAPPANGGGNPAAPSRTPGNLQTETSNGATQNGQGWKPPTENRPKGPTFEDARDAIRQQKGY